MILVHVALLQQLYGCTKYAKLLKTRHIYAIVVLDIESVEHSPF